MEDSYFGAATAKRTPAYIAIFAILFLLFILMLNTDLAQYSQHKDTGVPGWFFYAVFPVDALVFLSLAAAFFYRKIGVFLFPVLVLAHHILYEFYLSTTLLSGLHLLFAFIGAGLLVVIPRWKIFK